jgi:phospholipid/cholesterol/gamma-HCH transport system permease protein
VADAIFHIDADKAVHKRVVLSGRWSLRAANNDFGALQHQLSPLFADPFIQWDLSKVEQLDSAAAAMLLTGWSGKVDNRIALKPEHAALFSALIALPAKNSNAAMHAQSVRWWQALWTNWQGLTRHILDFLALSGSLTLEILHILRHPRDIPWKEITANMVKGGVMALPVTALVGVMIGIAMSYLMALQLRKFGADIFIINILGLSIVRELGPILMSVLVAGRSGSAMTAQIGVMRVTEEIDALATMGVSQMLRLILPKVVGLTLVAPLLLFWTALWALIGGMVVAFFQLGIGFEFFIEYLPRVLKPVNLTIALIKGLVFGLLVALVACHFGLRVKPNTESLSTSTTASVVTAITVVILVDALFAIATREIGI